MFDIYGSSAHQLQQPLQEEPLAHADVAREVEFVAEGGHEEEVGEIRGAQIVGIDVGPQVLLGAFAQVPMARFLRGHRAIARTRAAEGGQAGAEPEVGVREGPELEEEHDVQREGDAAEDCGEEGGI